MTAAELDAMPLWSEVRDVDGYGWQQIAAGVPSVWRSWDRGHLSSTHLVQSLSPITPSPKTARSTR